MSLALPVARFGSVADAAAYAGLSAKTIRRLIGAGQIRGLRVRRRVLVPFEDVDRLIFRPEPTEGSTMATAPTTASPPRSVDVTGRALRLTPEEIRQRAALAIQAMESIEDIGDEAEQRESLEYLTRALNESPLSDRPRFRACD